jgi:ankyrin repeat protein
MLAAWQGHINLCRWLIDDVRVDPHVCNRWGCNAIFKACRMDGQCSTLGMLTYVHDLGVSSDVVNAGGYSPLHKAAIYGRDDVCTFLLEHTTVTRAQMMPGHSRQKPSDMANFNGFPALASKLRHVEDVLFHAPVVWVDPLGQLVETVDETVPGLPIVGVAERDLADSAIETSGP